ncbi:alpha/beta fold hydrolase [Pseudonocardia phyllosphaerae]|uniref:alpha/beta fold hydrolase n=1 Tax=Pseudonocardia phyllosphaerae TaxID=3390502 RepID=UPI00397C555A
MIDVDGDRYEYEDIPGDGDRAPLLFLHEGLGSVGLWRGFHQRIAEATGRRTVAYSRLGHGRSGPPHGPRTREFHAVESEVVVPAVCRELGLERPVLIGHSDGGTIALLAAAVMPVTGVVTMAPHVVVEEFALAAIRDARTAYETGDLRTRMSKHHDDPDVPFYGWNDQWLSAEFRDWDVRAPLSAITAPVLAVQGTEDPYGSAVHVREVAERSAGPVQLVEPVCGHSPHLEQPDETAAVITEFLAGLP